MRIDVQSLVKTIYRKFLKNERVVSTLYYTTNNVENLDFIPFTTNSPYAGLQMTYMTDKTFTTLDNNKLISFTGYRLVPPVDGNIHEPKYDESFTITTPQGNLTAKTVYTDYGTTFVTELDKLEYMVLGGTGIYSSAFKVVIYFDNYGNKFGPAHSRIVKIYEHYL